METNSLKLYRKRIIPEEFLLLKNDTILRADDEVVVTSWDTINPKTEFSHGCSCYYRQLGFKISKFYRSDNTLLYWYCDIVDYSYDAAENALTATDLLADVILYPDGRMKVVDLDELAEAYEKDLISKELLTTAVRRLNELLTMIYRDKFERLANPLTQLGL